MNKHRYIIQRQAWEKTQVGKYAEAVADLSHLIEQIPNDPETHLQLATALFYAGEYKDSETHYKTAQRLAPASAEPDYGLATVLLNSHRREEAISLLRDAADKEASYEKEAAAALLAYLTENYEEAIRRFLEAEKWINEIEKGERNYVSPERYWGYAKIGEAYLKLHNFHEAIHWLTAATNSQRPERETLCSLGLAYLNNGNLSQATQAIQTCLARDPDYLMAHIMMARIALKRRRPLLFLRHFVRAFRLKQRGETL